VTNGPAYRTNPAGGEDRHALGLWISSQFDQLECSLVRMRGRRAGASVEIRHSFRRPILGDLASWGRGGDSPPARTFVGNDPTAYLAWRRELTEIQVDAVADLLADARIAPSEILLLGADDPGIWGKETEGGYLPLTDSIALAERTGMNVLSAFPARDVVRGGRGGPILSLPEWILLRAGAKDRILVRFGESVRMSFLPRASVDNPRNRILSLELLPSLDWFERLERERSEGVGTGPGTVGKDALRAREGAAVFSGMNDAPDESEATSEGRVDEKLLATWKSVYDVRPSSSEWAPPSLGEMTICETLRASFLEGPAASQPIARATAIALAAEAVVNAMDESLPMEANPREIVVHAEESDAELFRREMELRKKVKVLSTKELGVEEGTLDAVGVAMLCFLYLDQVPGNLPLLTGADVGRVLGELTSGSPQSWQILLQELGGSAAAIRPLRSAL
jgi:anhydro-N-acetylmuramic acid kinase